MTEQRYKAVLAVIADGRTVTEVAKDGLVIPCVPGSLYKSGKSRPQRVVGKRPKSGVCITIIPPARGLATSPGRRARLRLPARFYVSDEGGVASPNDRRPLADYYFVLGVPPDATETELHAAWRRQLKYWHPDRGNHPDALEHAK